VRHAVIELLEDPRFRNSASNTRHEILQLPPPSKAARLLMSLVERSLPRD
jgi:hypothetical protein